MFWDWAMIFLESMSVNPQTVQLLRQELVLLRHAINSSLSNYRTLLLALPASMAMFTPSAVDESLGSSQAKSAL
jgi:uncharacterized protein (DUF1800 family)